MQVIKAKIVNSKIYPENKKHWDWTLKGYNNKNVEIIFKEYRNCRSKAQNRLYWKYLSLIAMETGEDETRMHKYFKSKFLRLIQYKVFGKIRTELMTTINLNTKDFCEYIKKIENETEIPVPNIWLDDLNKLIIAKS